MTVVELIRVRNTLQNVGVIHGLPALYSFSGGGPSVARSIQPDLQPKPSFAKSYGGHHPSLSAARRAKDGGADRNRTCDLLIANETKTFYNQRLTLIYSASSTVVYLLLSHAKTGGQWKGHKRWFNW